MTVPAHLLRPLFALAAASALVAAGCSGPMTPEKAVDRLQEGNERFVDEDTDHPRIDRDRIEATRWGQRPFATVLGCSDSRVPVEILFDQGIGDLFVIRVAGNVCDTDEIASIEYGVDHLKTPLLVVLGHESCGAVTAVVKGAELHGHLPKLLDNIQPALEAAKTRNPYVHGDDLIPVTVRLNVWQAVEDLFARSAATRARVRAGDLQVVGAVYSLETGAVEWLGEHPEQFRLMSEAEARAEKSADGKGKHL